MGDLDNTPQGSDKPAARAPSRDRCEGLIMGDHDETGEQPGGGREEERIRGQFQVQTGWDEEPGVCREL